MPRPTPGTRGMPTPPAGTGIGRPTLRPLPWGTAPTAKAKAVQSKAADASFLTLGKSVFIPNPFC